MVRSSVRVFVRTRPTSHFAHGEIDIAGDGKNVEVHLQRNPNSGFVNNQASDFRYQFDRVLHNVSQETVFEECGRPALDAVLQGFNGTILAYGQTGAGKTFTMSGGLASYEYRGLIPRSISELFRHIHAHPELAYTVRISYVEIYNENLYDLLSPTFGTGTSDPVDNMQIQEESNGNMVVRGLSHHAAASEEEALTLFFEGEANRAVAEHTLNKASSRSHCIFQIHVESRSRVDSLDKALRSKLNLVDLAGSERVSKTHSEGSILKEAKYINRSLSFLEQVVLALSNPSRDHVPYRQSKLTYLLKDSLGGNCKTLMVANVWCEHEQLEETISTLKFATRMMRVSNDAVVNVHTDPDVLLRQYEKEIRELKQELTMHDQLANRSNVSYEPFTEDQKTALRETARDYLEERTQELEIVNLRQVRELFEQFRNLYRNTRMELSESMRPQAYDDPRVDSSSKSSVPQSSSNRGVGELDSTASSGFGLSVAAPDLVKKKKMKPALIIQNDFNMSDSQKHTSVESSKAALPDYNAAFLEFKKTEGRPIVDTIKQHSASVKQLKSRVKETSLLVNNTKKRIDDLKILVASKREERESFESSDAEEIIIDEEEYEFISKLKQAKQDYRESFEVLKEAKRELDFTEQRLLPQSKEELLSRFQAWFEELYGEKPTIPGFEEEYSNPVRASASSSSRPDQMDVGEAFEQMEMERISERDPDALAYFNAQKSLALAHARMGRKSGGKR